MAGVGHRAGTREQGWVRPCLPHGPFIASPPTPWSSPGSPGSSLVVLFSMVCPSRGPLLCRLTLSNNFPVGLDNYGTILFPFFMARFTGDSISGAFITGGLALGWLNLPKILATMLCQGLILDATVLWEVQLSWPNPLAIRLVCSGPLGDLSSQNVGTWVLAFSQQ